MPSFSHRQFVGGFLQLHRCLTTIALFGLLSAASLLAQSSPEPIPGVSIPNGNTPWALDLYYGKQEIVPIHHTEVELNNHKGANVAGSLAGSVFYKPKATTEIDGAHARVALHSDKLIFFVHVMDDPGGDPSVPSWAIVRATVKNDRRILAQITFTQLTGNAKRNDSLVETVVEKLDNGWLKIISKEPLSPGEYALEPVMKVANTFSTAVFDFTVDPKGPNAPDAISAPSQ
jgi:hypothetical protein